MTDENLKEEKTHSPRSKKQFIIYMFVLGGLSCAGVLLQLVSLGEFIYMAIMGMIAGIVSIKARDSDEKEMIFSSGNFITIAAIPVFIGNNELEVWRYVALFFICLGTPAFFLTTWLVLFGDD